MMYIRTHAGSRLAAVSAFLFIAFSMAFFLFPAAASASIDDKKVYDDGGLLSAEEESRLEKDCRDYGKKGKLDIVIVTMDDPSLPDCEVYLEDMYDSLKFGFDKEYGDTVMIVVDLARRTVAIQGYGKAETHIAQERGDKIRTRITPDLTNGNYFDAFQDYIKLSARYVKVNPSISPDNLLLKLWFQLVLALVIAGAAVLIMMSNNSTKMTAGGSTYLDPSHSKVIARYDRYIRTTVTRHKKPDPPSGGGFSGGGSGGGSSSGGHSHSSSRGSF